MEEVVTQETIKTYTGKYSSFLGSDKLTDVLRLFIQTTRREMEEYRILAIRQLRDITNGLFDLIPELNRILFSSINSKFEAELGKEEAIIGKRWSEELKKSTDLKERHLKELRPNLSHPENAKVLEELNLSEKSRADKFRSELTHFETSTRSQYFQKSNKYFICLMNNFNFLCLFYDNWLLNEDFIKLPGDETVEKPHLSLKQLLIMQKKGELKDTSSLRSIQKQWAGFDLDTFSHKDLKWEFTEVRNWFN
jgi:hypothetical protein